MVDPLNDPLIRQAVQRQLEQGEGAAKFAAEQMVRYLELYEQWRAEWQEIAKTNEALREQLGQQPLRLTLDDIERVAEERAA